MSRQDETYSGAHVGHNPAHGSAPHLSSSRESQQGAVASAADAALPHNHVSAASTHSSNPHGGGDYLRTISSLGSSADAQASSGGVALATDERVLAVRTRVMNCLRVAADDLQLLERELRPDSRNSTPTRGAPAALSHPHSSVCCDAVSVESRRLRSIIDAMSASAEEACTASLPDISGTSVASPKPVPAPRDSHHRRDEARPWKVLHVERNPAFLAGAPPSRQVVPQPEKPATQSTQSLADQVELDELRQQLATLQLQTKRLASVFKGKIEEFRKAVQSLTGYRVDLHEAGERQYHLYVSSDSSKVLRFRCNAQGDFELLESMFASEMLSVPTVRHLLETKQLIPAFLAAVLLEHLHRVGKRK